MRKTPANPIAFIVTVEHASSVIPKRCETLLEDYVKRCETHQIYDPGTKAIGEELASRLGAPLFMGECTRLAIDLNRSIGNEQQFSPPILEADELLKDELLKTYYIPFRNATKSEIAKQVEAGQTVVHLSIHSFTKSFKGAAREVDLGILFDDKRERESLFANSMIKLLKALLPNLTLRANEPYHGREDGHTTALRRRFPDTNYIGIELEFSQDLHLDLDAESYSKLIATTLRKLAEKAAD